MSVWSKQAIPLIFFDVVANAIETSGERDETIIALNKKIKEQIGACWNLLKKKRNYPKGAAMLKKASEAAGAISIALTNEWMCKETSQIEIIVAMCIIADDTIDNMKRNVEDREAWTKLLELLYIALEMSDPEEKDTLGMKRGGRIADAIFKVAQ